MGGTNLRRTAAIVTGVALGLTACSPTTGGRKQQQCTWTIGIMGLIEGEFAEFAGEPPARGVQVAVDLANEGGELACTLETHSENTEDGYKEAPVQAQRLVDDEDLVTCVCGYYSRETLFTGEVFEGAGVAMLSLDEESRVRERGFDTWFRLVAPTDAQGAATALYIRRAMAPRRVAVVSVFLPYAEEIAEAVAEGLGGRFKPPIIPLNPEESGVSDASDQIRRMSADLVFYAGFGPEGWELLNYIRESGGSASKVPFVTDGGSMYAPLAREHDAPRALLSCACSDATELPGAEAFVAEHRERYGTDPRPFAADAFDGTNIVIDALSELDGTESTEEVRAHVVAYLDAASGVEGTVKQYTWDEDGELVAGPDAVWMWEWTRRGGFRMLGSVADLTR